MARKATASIKFYKFIQYGEKEGKTTEYIWKGETNNGSGYLS
jgi:hypothetical protein